MKYSRRDLLRVAPAALAVVTFPREFTAAATADNGVFTRQKFAALVNTSFRVQLESGASRWFTLLSIEDIPQPAASSASMPHHLTVVDPRKLECFALKFQSPGEPLGQKTYVFESESVGRLPLFIVPSGSGYTAIINRLSGE